MLLLKLLFLISSLYVSYCSESSEELQAFLSNQDGLTLMRTVIQIAYDDNKMDLVATVIRDQQENNRNVTLVGMQNVYGPDGNITEVRTVELHIPQTIKNKANGSLTIRRDDDDDNDDDNEDIYTILSELRKMFDLTTKLGFSMELSAEEYSKTGNIINSAYIDQNSLYGYTEGINILNKTIEVNSSKTVNDHIKELEAKNLPVAVHKFDGDGQFLRKESNIIPEYVVSIMSEEGEVDKEILEEAQKGLAEVYLQFGINANDVPTKLSEYLGLKYPQYHFYVFLNEPKAWYINKDFQINLRYDLSTWDSGVEIFYSIFAVTKDEKVINST